MKFWLINLLAFALVLSLRNLTASPNRTSASSVESNAASDVTKYLIDSWETEDGLPQNSVISIAQTPDGYLWFGTFTGLARFDGVKFTVYDPSNTPALPSPCAVRLYVDRQGRLWVCTDNGIGYWQNHKMQKTTSQEWRFFHEAEGWSHGYAISFVEGCEGNLLISTIGKKILRFTGDRFVEFPVPEGEAARSSVMCVVDSAGAIWAKGDNYFGYFEDGKWVTILAAKDFKQIPPGSANLHGIAPSRDGGIWLADSRRIRKYHPDAPGWTRTLNLVGTHLQESLSLYEDSHGNLWAGAWQNGLFFFNGDGEMRRFTTQEGLRHNAIRTIFEDREGNIWVGTDGGGVTRFKRRTFFTYDKGAGLPESLVNTVVEESPGRMLVGTHGGGLVRLENNRFSNPIPGFKITGDVWVHSALVDRQGMIWAAVLGEGLFRIPGTHAQHVSLGEYDATFIRVLFEDSHGTIWVGGDGGLLAITHDNITEYGRDKGLPPVKVRAIIEDHAGDLWVGTRDDGIFRWQQGRFTKFTHAEGGRFCIVRAFYVDAEGTLWIGTTGHGLCRFRAGKLTQFTEAQGFPFGSITVILEDDFGYFWLGSDQGVVRVSRAELDALAGGNHLHLRWQIFHKSDGLNTKECNSGYQPAACKASDGRLWFAMAKGLAVVDPKLYKPNAEPPPVCIERVAIDRNSQAIEPSHNQTITVPAGSKRIQIYYTGLSFVAPEKMRFAYQLEGLDASWVEVGTERVMSFQDLRPGHYRFRVRAANNDGVWNETGASLRLSVLPFFWQTWWFRLLGVLALIAGASGAVWRVQENKLRRQREHLEHQKALQEKDAELRRIMSAISDYVWSAEVDTDGQVHYRYYSPAVEKITGYPTEFYIEGPERWLSTIHPEDRPRLLEASNRARAGQSQREEEEYRIVRSNGVIRWVRDSVMVEKLQDGCIRLYGVVTDVTERKRAETEIRKLNEELEQRVDRRTTQLEAANQELEAFSYSVSHDLRAPLRHINGFVGLLQNHLNHTLDEKGKRYFAVITEATMRMDRLIEDLLAFSRMGRSEMLHAPVHFQQLVQTVIADLEPDWQGRAVEWQVQPLPVVCGDPAMLKVVLTNLLSNALKFTRRRERAVVEIGCLNDAPHEHVFYVRDNGIGFDVRYSDKLFGVFQRLHSIKEFGGTGIGLATVRRIIHRHGGRTWAEGQINEGAIFYFSLPKTRESAGATEA
jgi:PAS domain S-box-containing protein